LALVALVEHPLLLVDPEELPVLLQLPQYHKLSHLVVVAVVLTAMVLVVVEAEAVQFRILARMGQ
jgi:hypothetical protein